MLFQLEELLNSFIPSKHSWKIALFKEWNALLGPLAHNVRIEAIKGPILILGVPHSTWAHELSFLAEMLLEKINKHIGETKIVSIRFQVVLFNRIKKQAINTYKNHSFSPQNQKKLTLTSREAVCLKKIKSVELQEALLGYFSHCKAN